MAYFGILPKWERGTPHIWDLVVRSQDDWVIQYCALFSTISEVKRISPTAEQLKSLGNFSERQRIQRLKPRNEFGRPGAFARMTPERAFEGTRFPPRGSQENAFRGLAAVDLVIQDVLAKGPGIVDKAMRRSGLPGGQAAITFRWGSPSPARPFVTRQRNRDCLERRRFDQLGRHAGDAVGPGVA